MSHPVYGTATHFYRAAGLLSPYHGKYNPIERCRGILEQHWNGDMLDGVSTVINFAQAITWKGQSPVVHLLTTVYQTGVHLTKKAMESVLGV